MNDEKHEFAIKIYDGDRRRLLPLLLLADESEEMVSRYIDRGEMFIIEADGRIAGECIVTDEGDGVLELKSLAIAKEFQKKGFGRALVSFIADRYRGSFSVLQAGTGDSPLTMPFYRKCGFVPHSVIPGFFTDNYDHPIIEGGVVLRDMIVLRKVLK